MKDLLTTKEAANVAKVTDARIRQLILEKVLPSEKFGNMHLIKREDLKLIKNRNKEVGRPKGSKNKTK